MTLTNKTILITGANRGIGRAIAEELSHKPVNLLLGMRNLDSYVAFENYEALSIKPVVLDLSSKESISSCLEDLEQDLENVDILINNAGQFVAGPLQKQSVDDVYSMFQVNILGLIQITNKMLPLMLKRPEAKIVNNASIAGYAYLPDKSNYSATKAAVVGFSEALRRELSGTSVSLLHLVTPGVDTEMMKQVEATYKNNEKPIELQKIPAKTWAKKVVSAIETDKKMLSPSGTTEILKIISHGPPLLVDILSRRMFKK
jgi:3-oxoacyl-[acyl-carrier protein] reductase